MSRNSNDYLGVQKIDADSVSVCWADGCLQNGRLLGEGRAFIGAVVMQFKRRIEKDEIILKL